MFFLLLLGRNLMPDDCAHMRNNVGFVLNDSQRRTLEQEGNETYGCHGTTMKF